MNEDTKYAYCAACINGIEEKLSPNAQCKIIEAFGEEEENIQFVSCAHSIDKSNRIAFDSRNGWPCDRF